MSMKPQADGASRLKALLDSGPEQPHEAIRFEIMVFSLQGERLAIELPTLKTIVALGDQSFVPGAPDFVVGLVNYRGGIVPVIDLLKLLHLGETELRDGSLMMVVEVEGIANGVGCVIDKLEDIVKVTASQVQPPLATFTGRSALFIEGQVEVGGEWLAMVKFDALAEEAQAHAG